MTNHEIEANLRRTFGREAPDALPGILSDCEKQKGTAVSYTHLTLPTILRV